VVLSLDGPLEVRAHPDPAQAGGRYETLVGGLHTRPALIAHHGRQFGVQVSLTPFGARALLALPAAELAGMDGHLTAVLGSPGAELVERFRAARDWPGRFAAIERVLLTLLRDDRAAAPPEVREAWRLTTAAAGRLPVAEIARRVGWSDRHLLQRFRAETGLTPKEAARVARFDRARRALAARAARRRPLDLAALAAAAGFYDQAHLTRDWRAFTGLPPSRWLAEEFGFVQDAAVLSEALSLPTASDRRRGGTTS
jgi:AraC-like DNA-binding protein